MSLPAYLFFCNFRKKYCFTRYSHKVTLVTWLWDYFLVLNVGTTQKFHTFQKYFEAAILLEETSKDSTKLSPYTIILL